MTKPRPGGGTQAADVAEDAAADLNTAGLTAGEQQEAQEQYPLSFLNLTGTTKTVVDWVVVAVAIWVLIAADPAGLGFMGVGNYLATDGEIRRSLNNVSIDGVAPTLDNAQSRDYPLTRPLFLYVAVDALEEQSVHDFVEHYVANVEQTLPRVYYYALPEEAYELIETRLQDRTTGTVFDGVDPGEADVVELLREG